MSSFLGWALSAEVSGLTVGRMGPDCSLGDSPEVRTFSSAVAILGDEEFVQEAVVKNWVER